MKFGRTLFCGWLVACATGSLLAGPSAATKEIQIVSAGISYAVAGDWDRFDRHDPEFPNRCNPMLHRGPNEAITVQDNVLNPDVTLEMMATNYCKLMERMTGAKCKLSPFKSSAGVEGYNITFEQTLPESETEMKTIRSSVYIFLNRGGRAVTLQYAAEWKEFHEGVDKSIAGSLKWAPAGG